MARFKVGEWVREMTPECEWLTGRVIEVDGPRLVIETESGKRYIVMADKQQPAPPPVGERPGHFDVRGCAKCGSRYVRDYTNWLWCHPCQYRTPKLGHQCACRDDDFDPSLWCACTPEPVCGSIGPGGARCDDKKGHPGLCRAVSEPKAVSFDFSAHDIPPSVMPCRCPQGHWGEHEDGCSKL